MSTIFKSVLMAFHLLLAVILCLVMIVLPKNIRHMIIQYWAKRLLRILKIKITLSGEVLKFLGKDSYLVVSNHISWLDIPVIFSLKPMTFVSASDVKTWPIIGMLAKISGAIFVERNRKSSLVEVIQAMNHHFKNEKRSICIFPEGVTSNGYQVLPFKSNLFQSAFESNVLLLPLSIKYKENNVLTNRTSFHGSTTLFQSFKRVAKSNLIEVVVDIGRPIKPSQSRKDLSLKIQEVIALKIN
ncbi:MAG: 1-acyl-sn-glycerol-3-phosphate acyltransferase [Methylophilaceae bacterium]|jgi:1-acyl-sn-glycerol-3-phosphate acyltransferase|nr:1-acyl-sn-glycerol-3-phosphate acyltransferase [Methylophilaceae bacterium]NDF81264.1 1-acyl-sn-glycerol-3-phosphate acyltransferase [Methylophilaceae bacterium]